MYQRGEGEATTEHAVERICGYCGVQGCHVRRRHVTCAVDTKEEDEYLNVMIDTSHIQRTAKSLDLI
jgi:hypothetical protein